MHAVVANHAGDAEAIVFENRRAALALGFAMLRHIAPCRYRTFIAKKRQRQDLALLGQALEPFDRDEAIDGFQYRLQFSREVEVFLLVLGLRPDFENDSYHPGSPLRI